MAVAATTLITTERHLEIAPGTPLRTAFAWASTVAECHGLAGPTGRIGSDGDPCEELAAVVRNPERASTAIPEEDAGRRGVLWLSGAASSSVVGTDG